MSATETTGPKRGQLVFPDGNEIVRRGVKASTSLVVGDPITFDSNGFMLKASDSVGNQSDGLGTIIETADNSSGADGDIKAQAVMGNTYIFQQAGAAIKPFALVQVDSAFKLIVHGNPGNATTPTAGEVDAARDYYGLSFGRYFGKAREEDNPTSAALDDVIVVRQGN